MAKITAFIALTTGVLCCLGTRASSETFEQALETKRPAIVRAAQKVGDKVAAAAAQRGDALKIKAKKLAVNQFFGKDTKIQDSAEDPNGSVVLIKRLDAEDPNGWAVAKWIPVKTYRLLASREDVLNHFRKDTSFAAGRVEQGMCGDTGPTYVVKVAVRQGKNWNDVKFYMVSEEKLRTSAHPPLMADNGCREQ